MIDLSLRFENEDAAKIVLQQFHTGTEWKTASHHHALDPIGPIVTSAPVVDPETREIVTPATVDNRFHVNLLTDDQDLADSLSEHVVVPSVRRRVWA